MKSPTLDRLLTSTSLRTDLATPEGGTTSPLRDRGELPRQARPEGCFAAMLSPLRGKAGLASQGTTGQRSTTHYGGPTAGAADSDRCWTGTTRATSSRPHSNGARSVTSDMTGSEPGRRLSVGTYRRNRPIHVRERCARDCSNHTPRPIRALGHWLTQWLQALMGAGEMTRP